MNFSDDIGFLIALAINFAAIGTTFQKHAPFIFLGLAVSKMMKL